MSQIQLSNLVAKLDPNLRTALEQAAGAAMNKNAPVIEIEHWLVQILLLKNSAVIELFTQQKVDQDALLAELTMRLEGLSQAAQTQPSVSKNLSDLIEDAWMLASVNFNQGQIVALHLILALLQTDSFGIRKLSLKALQNVSVEALQGQIAKLKISAGNTSAGVGANAASSAGGECALDKYTVNLTAQARDGKIDPISGRNSEVRMAIDILCRKRQNNPILVGEPGVGKTAVVEGLALRIVANEVPPALQGVELHTLDLGLLQAGASIKGEFENRLKDVINEVKNADVPIIMFIDEAHTLIGAGGAAGQNDAANLLKPALARGEFKTLAATTWAEYKKYFEKDPALTRRFQVVKIEEPNEQDAMQMLRGVARSLSDHHGVFIREDAIEAAVKLSVRYLPARQLPDKAISLLDTASARIALTQGAKPEQLEQLQQKISYMNSELQALQTEQAVFGSDGEIIAEMQQRISLLDTELVTLEQRWQDEQQLVTQLIDLNQQLQAGHREGNVDPQQQQQLLQLSEQLEELQGDTPLVHALVDMQTIAAVISNWTGIPAGSMVKDEVAKLLSMEQGMHQRVIGQTTAISELSKSIRISRAGLTDSRKPVGVFLMCGPSGVGKTETAMALADQVFGGSDNLNVINMTEFKEEHKISMLLGSPAGYVGFGEGGVLTEAIRRNPYSVLLLDEMEKAHSGVHDMFYQIFDKGYIKDSEGRSVDFRNTIIIMTSNAADQAICQICDQQDEAPDNTELLEQIRPELQKFFKPAFLGRCTVIPYYPLKGDELKKIAEINLCRIEKKLRDQYAASFTWSDEFLDFVVGRNIDPTTGGRAIEQIINRSLMPKLAEECILRLSEGEPIDKVVVDVEHGKLQLSIS
ncbi:MAG: type VI secretion system ATPase TssH [Pseudomonadales bacterium]|nr:type VI secretion system ATPase TssH [Pseudomonadales bacterium]NRA17863.1 type VI secretion system ATPase TssH [Oceanospirillaceae bacterium]